MSKYQAYENTDLWKSIDRILEDLEENSDIKITTARKYVVGYFCENLQKKLAKSPDAEAEDFDKF